MIKNKVKKLIENSITTIEFDDKYIYLVGPVDLPLKVNDTVKHFNWYSWYCSNKFLDNQVDIFEYLNNKSLEESQVSSMITYGDFEKEVDSLIRMHSICHTGDIFNSQKCDCGDQLSASLEQIIDNGSGALFYLANHEGRGIGLINKAFAYILQQNGFDTVEANTEINKLDDTRNYNEALCILKYFRKDNDVTFLTNNPKKIAAAESYGFSNVYYKSLWSEKSKYREKYILTKVQKAGHLNYFEEEIFSH